MVDRPPPRAAGRQRLAARTQHLAGASRQLYRIEHYSSQSTATVVVVVGLAVMIVVGAIVDFPPWWFEFFTTGTSAMTLVMVFAIQHTAAREQTAIQRKLDELLRAVPEAEQGLMLLEEAPDDALRVRGGGPTRGSAVQRIGKRHSMSPRESPIRACSVGYSKQVAGQRTTRDDPHDGGVMRRITLGAAVLAVGGIAAGCGGVGATTAPVPKPSPSTTSITSRASSIPSRVPSRDPSTASAGAPPTTQQLMQVANQEKPGESTQWQQCVANWMSTSLPANELQVMVDDTADQLLSDPTTYSNLVQANEACAQY